MTVDEIISGKREWRAHKARVAALPRDYQVVYRETERYLFKTAGIKPAVMTSLLSEVVVLFEEGANAGKGVLEVTGKEVAAFCDGLVEESDVPQA